MHRTGIATVLGFAVALGAAPVFAHGGGGDTVLIPLPPFPPGDGAKAQARIAELDARKSKDAELAKVVAEPLMKAKLALQRAYGARTSGDAAHAVELEGLALEWVETAVTLERAATTEKTSDAAVKGADETVRKVERARALLSETQARKERAAAELVRAKSEEQDRQGSAASAEAARLAGKKAAPKATQKPPQKGSQ